MADLVKKFKIPVTLLEFLRNCTKEELIATQKLLNGKEFRYKMGLTKIRS